MSPRDKVRHSTALEIPSVSQTPEKSCPYKRYIEGKWATASNTCLNVIDESELTQLDNGTIMAPTNTWGKLVSISDPLGGSFGVKVSSLECLCTCGAHEFFRQAGSGRKKDSDAHFTKNTESLHRTTADDPRSNRTSSRADPPKPPLVRRRDSPDPWSVPRGMRGYTFSPWKESNLLTPDTPRVERIAPPCKGCLFVFLSRRWQGRNAKIKVPCQLTWPASSSIPRPREVPFILSKSPASRHV